MRNDNEKREFEQATFQRCPRDSENPYSMISNSLIRDESISPDCRWLIIYLLSNKDNWKIKMSQIINHVKRHMGRDRVYIVMNEAIKSGYIQREKIKRGNLEHITYYVSEIPELKKSFRHPDFQDPEIQDTENTHYKNTICKKNQEKNTVFEPAVELTHFFFEKLQEINPKIKKPDLTKWAQEIDRLIKIDSREESEVRQVVDFIVEQHKNPKREFTWSKAVSSPQKLRKHFAAIWLEMNTKAPEKKKEDAEEKKIKTIEENRKWTKDISKKLPAILDAEGDVKFMVTEYSVTMVRRKAGFHQVVGYAENGFRETVINFLRKVGALNIESYKLNN